MTLEAVAGIGLLGFTVICSLVGGAYKLGQHSNRIESLEKRQDAADKEGKEAKDDISELKAAMTGLRAEMKGLKDSIAAEMHSGFEAVKALIGRGRRSSAE